MTSHLKPENEAQLLDVLKWAVSSGTPVDVRGHGSKQGFGNAMASDTVLDVSSFSGILQYDPAELVLRAGAATPMTALLAALETNNQRLAFDPVDLASILSSHPSSEGFAGTLGGMVACGLAGPGRLKYGGIRDHILGFHAVSGRGEVFKSGGNVMKNVTGFDLSKLMAGSMGTLAVMYEITIKVLPAPEKSRTLLLQGLNAEQAIQAMATAVNSPHEVSAAAYLPRAVAKGSDVDLVSNSNSSVTAVRVEGPEPSVIARCSALRKLLEHVGTIDELHSKRSHEFWAETGTASALRKMDNWSTLWRISVPPADGARVAATILGQVDGEVMFDWGGGLLTLGLSAKDPHAQSTIIREAVRQVTGHATLVLGDRAARQQVSVFQPMPPGIASLNKRIKSAFDPEGILNPGRIHGNG